MRFQMVSFLRWAGSKRQLLPELTRLIGNEFDRYVEPFAGSACVFFSISPKQALLGDINAELIHAYLEVKYRVEDIVSELRYWRKGERRYQLLRALPPDSFSPAGRAARFI